MSERIRLVVVGDLSFVGDRLREAAAAAERETAGNDRLLLRLCVSYGARHEVHRITSPLHLENEGSGSAAPQWAALSKAEQHSSRRGSNTAMPICQQLRSALIQGKWTPDEHLSQLGTAFFMALQGGNCPLPDMLIRTSGEARLSDFLLCEVSEGCFFHFVPVLWPDVRPWHLLLCLLHRQLFSFAAVTRAAAVSRLIAPS
ncbi:undecaprenyl diphosphate synthase [Cyclospora cayetanensis]|uniref:Undecaprenyl diphosphate synthase n=1 Tax=Cyclospora cayetanensis TaxID=88456 RepID=A0A1D3D425_9EIME|nr:undecaprenyl diphosphate synthase [Cyclospora cayetanensis]